MRVFRGKDRATSLIKRLKWLTASPSEKLQAENRRLKDDLEIAHFLIEKLESDLEEKEARK